jgi:glycosyltransferase involved in cell wall biosynthesis
MRILNISSVIPYPPIDGGRNGIYYPLRHLAARGHDITLACLTDTPDPDAVRHLETFCRVEVLPFSKKPTLRKLLAFLFSPRSFNLGRFRTPDIERRILELAQRGSFDVVEVALSVAWYGLLLKREAGLPVVLRVHNVHWINFARSISHWKNPLVKFYLWDEARKIRREELSIVAGVDLNLTVSDHDAAVLKSHSPGTRCVTVPAGVELGNFTGDRVTEDPRTVLWMGSLGWLPNQDSFWWFYRSIVPEILRRDPGVRIRVVGSTPPADIVALRHPSVEILGYVEDLRGVMRTSQVCVVPLRIGSGIRIKLLEMFADRRAVVSTSIGCEGLGVEDGRELLIADDPEGFAAAVVRLLDDASLRGALGDRARTHVEEHYDWKQLAQQYETAYRSVMPGGSARTSS